MALKKIDPSVLLNKVDSSFCFIRDFSVLYAPHKAIYQVKHQEQFYILKAARVSWGWGYWKLKEETEVLSRAFDQQGITHLVRDYGIINGYKAILKEYVDGDTLADCWRETSLTSVHHQIEGIVTALHQKQVYGLDFGGENIIISPNRQTATIVDTGGVCHHASSRRLQKKDMIRLEALFREFGK